MVLPKEIRDALGLQEGDLLLALQGEGEVLLVTPERYAALTRGLLRGTWGKTRQQVDVYLQEERDSWKGGGAETHLTRKLRSKKREAQR
jgi:AbrB family looped-hinge helix DNA binding protein